MRNLLVLDADYVVEEGKGVVRLFCKDEKGKTILVLDSTFEPYFYAKPKGGKLKAYKKKLLSHRFRGGKVKRVDETGKTLSGKEEKLLRIFLDNPRGVDDVRNVVKKWSENEEEYEYTIPFHQRYLIDKRIDPMKWMKVDGKKTSKEGFLVDEALSAKTVKPTDLERDVNFKVLAFDVELAEEKGEERIIMISFAGNDGFKKVLTTWKFPKAPKGTEFLRDEKEMLEKFVSLINQRDPDFLVGFNSDLFDFLKLRERSDKLKVPLKLGRDGSNARFVRRGRITSTKIKGRVHIDLYSFVSHVLAPRMKSEVLTLDAVANELLGERKKDMRWKDIEKSWKEKKGLDQLVEYSQWDSELTLRLAEQLLPQIFAISRLTGFVPFDSCRYTYSQLVEAYLMKKAVDQNNVIPNRPKMSEIKRRGERSPFKGGLVVEPMKGIHSDILVFDFRSLYPTIIGTHNISPETLNCKCCKGKNEVPELNHHFCTKVKGFIPKNIEELINERAKVKESLRKVKKGSIERKMLKNVEYALKIIANATYGYMGFVPARWYCYECAAAAASWGRFYIKKVIEMIKKLGFEVIYSDTDSCFVRIKEGGS